MAGDYRKLQLTGIIVNVTTKLVFVLYVASIPQAVVCSFYGRTEL